MKRQRVYWRLKTYTKKLGASQILGASRERYSKFHTEDAQILGAVLPNLISTAIRRPGFVSPWLM
jgi:hypothetical protein